MPTKSSTNGIHAQRLKDIRSFINFNYDLRKPLTQYQKKKIKTYWDEIDALTARPYYAYRPRKKSHLKKAQNFAQHEKQLPGLKVAFIPTNGKNPHIRFTKGGELIAESEHVRTRFLEFDRFALVDNVVDHVNEVIKQDPHAKTFTILAGRYEIVNSYSRTMIAEWTAKIAERYATPEANNYFGNWMIGLNSHTFKNQQNFDDFRTERAHAREKMQRDKKLRKRRAEYAKEQAKLKKRRK